MVMSWVPGDVSAIHDHGATQWGAVQCFGAASHWSYQFKNNFLQTKEYREILPGQIVRVNHELIHQMGNYNQDSFLSLHVYGIRNESASITGNARIFDLLENTIQYTDGGVFFCLPEADISRRTSELRADPISTLRHHQQMRNRISMILQATSIDSEYWQIKANQLDREIAILNQIILNN